MEEETKINIDHPKSKNKFSDIKEGSMFMDEGVLCIKRINQGGFTHNATTINGRFLQIERNKMVKFVKNVDIKWQ